MALKIPLWVYGVLVLGVIVLQALTLFLFGQPLVCECGHISLWAGDVFSSENSQQLSDWYSFSHVIHGFIFYFFATLVFKRVPWQARLLMAVGLEVGWEILENTPMIINHYREQALAQGYTGDSIINSLSDTMMMLFGFILAWRLPTWSIIILGIAMEVFVGFLIHDNLTLNTLNLFYQFDFIKEWQAGG